MPIVRLDQIPNEAIDALLDAAFGSDRHGRTAYRIREGTSPIAALSLGWQEGDDLIGSVQCWPVQLKTDANARHRLIMVGPVAVRPDRQQQGIGKRLMQRTMDAHDKLPLDDQCPMMMIGDEPYYRDWGFFADHTARWRLPGPYERDRLLLRWHSPQLFDQAGLIEPRI